jgi:hypothetical protein
MEVFDSGFLEYLVPPVPIDRRGPPVVLLLLVGQPSRQRLHSQWSVGGMTPPALLAGFPSREFESAGDISSALYHSG